jgi:hypothetical protein
VADYKIKNDIIFEIHDVRVTTAVVVKMKPHGDIELWRITADGNSTIHNRCRWFLDPICKKIALSGKYVRDQKWRSFSGRDGINNLQLLCTDHFWRAVTAQIIEEE